jgi:hypothetical protein
LTSHLVDGLHILALLSAEVDNNNGRNGCHLTLTTLSSCSRAFNILIFVISLVSAIIIFLSNPALATYLPSAE